MEQKLVGTWSIESEAVYNWSTANSDTSKFDQLTDCQRDNTFTFTSAKMYSEDEGTNVCPSNNNGKKFDWAVNAGDSTFTFYGVTTLSSAFPKITVLDNSTLVFVFQFQTTSYGSYMAGSFERCVFKKVQ